MKVRKRFLIPLLVFVGLVLYVLLFARLDTSTPENVVSISGICAGVYKHEEDEGKYDNAIRVCQNASRASSDTEVSNQLACQIISSREAIALATKGNSYLQERKDVCYRVDVLFFLERQALWGNIKL